MKRTRLCLAALLTLIACGSPKMAVSPTEVIVMGMIHGGHRTSESYSIARIRELVTAMDPDLILCEIPPGRLEPALEQYRETREVSEPRVRVFPEYVDALIPLQAEGGLFDFVPRAALTREMADDRRVALKRLETERPADHAEMVAGQEGVEACLERAGQADDPFFIDSAAYDACVKQGMEPYDRLFNEELGAGGWTNINEAHWALIAAALDAESGRGRRVLITLGAWHAYWFKEQLAQRRRRLAAPGGVAASLAYPM